jgi:hypothetical protein
MNTETNLLPENNIALTGVLKSFIIIGITLIQVQILEKELMKPKNGVWKKITNESSNNNRPTFWCKKRFDTLFGLL